MHTIDYIYYKVNISSTVPFKTRSSMLDSCFDIFDALHTQKNMFRELGLLVPLNTWVNFSLVTNEPAGLYSFTAISFPRYFSPHNLLL